MNEVMRDVIIIGGGPAGLTAGIYASRERLDTLLLEKGICGGLPATTDLVENYPGFPESINGMDLMNKFKAQAEKFGVKINEFNEVKKIRAEGKIIKIQTEEKEYTARTAIVASGDIPKRLNVPGEKEYTGKGVSYCATCDGPLYRDKDVAIIGCGNSGLQEGESLIRYVKGIYFIEFLPYITAAKILQERLQKNEKVKFMLNHALTSINGDTKINSVTVKDLKTGKAKEIKVSGVFIYVGFLPNSKFVEGIVKLDKEGYIITNEKMQTSMAGIYAAGDVRSKEIRQIGTACGDGTIAAISAINYIKELT